MMPELLAATVLHSIVGWFVYFIINHANLTAKVRTAAMPALPGWLRGSLECPLCLTFWILVAVSLCDVFTPLVVLCPPVVLAMDLVYCRLRLVAGPASAAQSPILPPNA